MCGLVSLVSEGRCGLVAIQVITVYYLVLQCGNLVLPGGRR